MNPNDALHNAAALMLLLGKEEAASIFDQLPAEQAHQLKVAIAEVAQSPKPALQSPVDVNFDEFEGLATRQSRLMSDSSRYVRNMLNQAFGLQAFAADAPMSEEGDPASPNLPVQPGHGLERLKRAELPTVVQLLVAEHPQVAAAILTLVDLELATRVLQNVPPRQRADIVQRIARTQAINSTARQALDDMLVTLLDELEARRSGAQSGARRAALLLSGLSAQMEASVLESIDSTDPALAQRILDKMDQESRP